MQLGNEGEGRRESHEVVRLPALLCCCIWTMHTGGTILTATLD